MPLLLDDGAKSYIYGPSTAPLAEIVDGSTVVHYLHADLIGSTRVITDHNGAVVGTTRFDEYGNRIGHSGIADSAIGYSGNLTDKITGLVYLRARDYDPATEQFLSVDPAVDSTHQPYAYVANNPLLFTDPTGLDFWGDVGSNAAAFGLGVLDGATFGVSSMILGAVVPGYNCFTEGNGWFTAGSIVGTVVSTVAVTALTAGGGTALAVAGIAGRLAIKEAVKLGISEARRLVASGVEKIAGLAGKGSTSEIASAGMRGPNLVYRGLAEGEDAAAGLTARAPSATGVSPISHVAGKVESPWISTSRSFEVASEKYGGNGVIGIDLNKVGTEVVDLTRGFPGGGMLSNWAKADQEVLIFGRIPAEAIVKVWP